VTLKSPSLLKIQLKSQATCAIRLMCKRDVDKLILSLLHFPRYES